MAFSTPDTHIAGYIVLASDWNEFVANFLAVNEFFFKDLNIDRGRAPMSGINAAALTQVESSGAGTAKPIIYQLNFDKDTDEGRMWVFRMPPGYGVSMTLNGSYKMLVANTDDEVVLVAQVAAVSDGDALHSAKVFDSENSLTQTVPDDADKSKDFEIPLTNDDSVAAGDWVCIMFFRDANDGADNADGDLILTSLEVRFDLAS